ncbi:MAG: hypothetical protein J6X51_06020, partial [Bacteroidales bacterium]|nr:hypothetical protein [Bacteroidales bacterium]
PMPPSATASSYITPRKCRCNSLLTPWGFTQFSKPGHQYFEACREGRFLILAPWEHQNEKIPLTRTMCLTLNEMTKQICEL